MNFIFADDPDREKKKRIEKEQQDYLLSEGIFQDVVNIEGGRRKKIMDMTKKHILAQHGII